MILDSVDPIDLAPLLKKLELQVELRYLELPAGVSPFDDVQAKQAIEDAVREFGVMVEDLSDQEGEIRRALSWLLHQDDDVLVGVLQRGAMSFPPASAGDQRRYLEWIWDNVFADWRVEGFDPAAFEVTGLPG